MARFGTGEIFDILSFDFNWFLRNYETENLTRGANQTLDRIPYRDVLVLHGLQEGTGFRNENDLTFAGTGLTGSFARGTVAGAVTRMTVNYTTPVEEGYFVSWVMLGFSVSARAILNAAKTPSNADDVAIFAQALRGDDVIHLSGFDDRMNGFAGRDTINGYDGDDTIYGGTGSDLIYGGYDSDLIFGGKGSDSLYGGYEPDTFVFDDGDSRRGAGTAGRDVIFDFVSGDDVLDLRLIDANTRQSGDQNFTLSASAAKNAVWFTVSGNNIIVSGDTNGNARPDFEIELRGITSLTADDFLL